jgi:hypothetical protein
MVHPDLIAHILRTFTIIIITIMAHNINSYCGDVSDSRVGKSRGGRGNRPAL